MQPAIVLGSFELRIHFLTANAIIGFFSYNLE